MKEEKKRKPINKKKRKIEKKKREKVDYRLVILSILQRVMEKKCDDYTELNFEILFKN